MHNADLSHSDYIVYVDESGDHSLNSIDDAYPLFVLSFCIFKKDYYSHTVTPALRMLKFSTFGHDMIILHEQDIRKKTGAFNILNKESREAFLEKLTTLIAQSDFTLLPIVIDKHKLKRQGSASTHIYHLATKFGLEQLYSFFQKHDQDDRLTHIIFESRGQKENSALELEFRRVCDGDNSFQKSLPFKIIIADKKTNSEGLQFADMVARPIGLSVLNPRQPNRAAKILEKKLQKITEEKQAAELGLYLYP